MGYDGGLSVKIINKELRRIINKYKKTGLFEDSDAFLDMLGAKYKGKTQTVYYEYLDCAYLQRCPKNIDMVLEYLIELFDFYAEDDLDEDEYNEFREELLDNSAIINANYTYVEWIYVHGDWSDAEEKYLYENGSGKYERIPDDDSEEEEQEYSYDFFESKERTTEERWLSSYGKYVEKKPCISFDGTLFVFTGLVSHSDDKDHPIIEKVLKKGGQYRSKVSGVTDYLIVNPSEAGESKTKAAIEQQKKGKNIKIVLLEDLEKVL